MAAMQNIKVKMPPNWYISLVLYGAGLMCLLGLYRMSEWFISSMIKPRVSVESV